MSRAHLHRVLEKFKKEHPTVNQDWAFHDLRHSFAYNYLKKGGDMYALQAILGHRQIKLTVDLYGQLKARDVANPSPFDV